MDSNSDSSLLQGIKIVSVALNAPGPVAAARLARLGAEVTKIEPPSGDATSRAAPGWYESLCEGQTVLRLDLKTPDGRAQLDDLLAQADLLLASFRPSALQRLGLDWESLHARHPKLCFVGIIGYAAPNTGAHRPRSDVSKRFRACASAADAAHAVYRSGRSRESSKHGPGSFDSGGTGRRSGLRMGVSA